MTAKRDTIRYRFFEVWKLFESDKKRNLSFKTLHGAAMHIVYMI